MICSIILAGCNIVFNLNLDKFNEWKIPHAVVQVIQHDHPSPTNGDGDHGGNGPRGDVNKQDAVRSITDELWERPSWWILETLPLPYIYKDDSEKDKWVTTLW